MGSNGSSRSSHPSRAPKNLDKMKVALRRIVGVSKSDVDAALARERGHKRSRKS